MARWRDGREVLNLGASGLSGPRSADLLRRSRDSFGVGPKWVLLQGTPGRVARPGCAGGRGEVRGAEAGKS